jgi:hypothetical protein
VIAGKEHTDWRRILVRLREAATRPWSLYGRVAATSRPDEKTSQAVCFLTEIALAKIGETAKRLVLRCRCSETVSGRGGGGGCVTVS